MAPSDDASTGAFVEKVIADGVSTAAEQLTRLSDDSK